MNKAVGLLRRYRYLGHDGSYELFFPTKTRVLRLVVLLENNESTSKTDIEIYIEQGAQYLITDKEEIDSYPELQKYLGEELSFNKSLRIFRLKK